MPQEIERKFKVKNDTYKTLATQKMRLTQGYLSAVPERTVRIRLKGDEAFITVKGKTNEAGTTRFEWEKPISVAEAQQLLTLCESGVIDKTRYLVPNGDTTIEVDEFHGDNEGLLIAEIELPAEDTPFHHPDWLGEEVTADPRYYNAMLTHHPYKKWR